MILALFLAFATAGTAQVTAIDSIGITVADLDRSLDFYTNVLHFEKVAETEGAGEALEHLNGVFGLRVRTARLRLGSEFIELTEYLAPRQSRVEFGSYSADFTDLHYVSLHFLLKHLISSQSLIVESFNRAVTMLPGGDETQELLIAVRQNEQENLAALKTAAA